MDANALSVEPPVMSPARSIWNQDLALPFEPWAVLWALALSAPWLLPTHMIPWRAFHADLLMALVLLPAAIWVVLRSRERIPLPPPADERGDAAVDRLSVATGRRGFRSCLASAARSSR